MDFIATGIEEIRLISDGFRENNTQQRTAEDLSQRETDLGRAREEIEREYRQCEDQRHVFDLKRDRRRDEIRRIKEKNDRTLEDAERKNKEIEKKRERAIEEMQLDHMAQMNSIRKNEVEKRRQCEEEYEDRKRELLKEFEEKKKLARRAIKLENEKLKAEEEALEQEKAEINKAMDILAEVKNRNLLEMQESFHEEYRRRTEENNNLRLENLRDECRSQLEANRRILELSREEAYKSYLAAADSSTRLLLMTFRTQFTDPIWIITETIEDICLTISEPGFLSIDNRADDRYRQELNDNLKNFKNNTNSYNHGLQNLRIFMNNNANGGHDKNTEDQMRSYMARAEELFDTEFHKNLYQLENSAKDGKIKSSSTIEFFYNFRDKLGEINNFNFQPPTKLHDHLNQKSRVMN